MLPGGGELLLILVVVLMLFGGKELPRIARTLGKYSSMMRKSLNEVKREFNRITIAEELKESRDTIKETINDAKNIFSDTLDNDKKEETPTTTKPENVERTSSKPSNPDQDFKVPSYKQPEEELTESDLELHSPQKEIPPKESDSEVETEEIEEPSN
jgi:sec-independent protein translocase protein TatA